jgi:methylmalonyl-CoA mutase N-terminal domain/subunit
MKVELLKHLEELCDQIEDGVWKYLKKIQKMGGSVKAIEKGFFQSEIRANAYRLKKETDDGDRVIVGVNKFSEEEEQPELLRIGGKVEIQQKKALKKLRAERDSKKLEKALSAMQSAADTEENLMPYIVSAAKAFATTGEISNTFREVFGEYRPKEVF